MPQDPVQQYDNFAHDYHWLYSSRHLSGGLALEENRDILSISGRESRILDCSCGIGTLTLALARNGFEVTGSDGSRKMIEQAIFAAKKAGLNVPFICSTWQELPKHFTDQFELVFCLGNSLGHCRSANEMLRSLEGMRSVLRNGGKLVIHSRNWEYLRQERQRITYFEWRERAGQRCLPIYVWDFPESINDVHKVDVVLVFDADGQASIRSYPVFYYPFRYEQLAERLKSAGFPELETDFSQNRAEYRVVAS